MDKYYKNFDGDYIVAIGTGNGDEEITKEEYENHLFVIRNRPTAEPGYEYKLRTDLTWERVEAPPIEDEEATEEDYIAALAELGVASYEEV